ncbi:MAG: type I restriction-modification system subunit M N-terminal domain-containing protein [Candidatus Micrarchaeaceae archaeon]
MVNSRPQQLNENGDLNFVDSLWVAANRLHGSVESAEYKHIVFGLISLKYISDVFIERQKYLEQAVKDPSNVDYYGISDATEDKDGFLSENIFWVPPEARWSYLMANFDDKIELNYEMNKTLEQMAQAIFKSWFVDFEFPNEEGKPYKSSGGEMVYSEELGKEIPK